MSATPAASASVPVESMSKAAVGVSEYGMGFLKTTRHPAVASERYTRRTEARGSLPCLLLSECIGLDNTHVSLRPARRFRIFLCVLVSCFRVAQTQARGRFRRVEAFH